MKPASHENQTKTSPTAIENRRRKIHFRSIKLPFFPSLFLAVVMFIAWYAGYEIVDLMPWLYLASLCICGRHALVEARFPGLFTWFIISFAGLFMLYPVLAPFVGLQILADETTFMNYSFLTICGVHLFIVAYQFSLIVGRRSKKWTASYRMSQNRLLFAIMAFFFINLFALLLLVIDAGSISSLMSATRVARKELSGTVLLISTYAMGAGSFFYPLVAVYLKRHRVLLPLFVAVMIVIEILCFLAFRTRTFFVLHTIGFLVGWYLIAPRVIFVKQSPYFTSRKVSFTQKALIAVAGIVIVLSAVTIRTYRGGFETGDASVDIKGSLVYSFKEGGALNMTNISFRILELVPATHGFLGGQSYYRLLFVPIPRALWPGKPPNTQKITAQWLDPGIWVGQTTPVGITGDLYINFGFVGILGMLVFGYIFGVMDRRNSLSNALFVSVSFAMIFHLARGGFTNPIISLALYWIVAKKTESYLLSRVSESKETGLTST